MNPNDQVRDAILRELYKASIESRSPLKAAIGVKELQSRLRPRGHKQQVVSHNLLYLLDKGWVRKDVIERSFTTTQGTRQPSQQVRYRISDSGVDQLEAASVYRLQDRPNSVNITNVGGVTVLGDGNVVNAQFVDATRVLEELRRQVMESQALSDKQRIGAVADIDSLRSQLAKPEPDTELIRRLWLGVERAGALAGAVELIEQLGGEPEEDRFYDAEGHVRYDVLSEDDGFRSGLDRLRRGVQRYRVALMCSEEDPGECPRHHLLRPVLGPEIDILHIRGDGAVDTDDEVAARLSHGQDPLFVGEGASPPWRSPKRVRG